VSFDCKKVSFLVIVGHRGRQNNTFTHAGEYGNRHASTIDGQDVTMAPPQDRDVAMVFENYALYPATFGARQPGLPLRSPRFRSSEMTSMSAFRKSPNCFPSLCCWIRLPRQLSQGSAARLLGRGPGARSKSFPVDEPISHLDAKLRNSMRRALKRMPRSLAQPRFMSHMTTWRAIAGDRVWFFSMAKCCSSTRTKPFYNHPQR